MNDRKGEIRVLLDLAKVKIAVASYAPATEYIERCLDLCEQIGEKSLMAEAYVVLGHLRDEAGDGDAAQAALETSSRLWRDLGDDVRVAEVAGMIRTATAVD
jgi:hypothetical protein